MIYCHNPRWFRFCLGAVFGLLTLALGAAEAASQCPDPMPDLVGTWEWVWSAGGFAGEVLTPESEGFTVQLEFTSDGTLIRYRDEVAEASAPYTIFCVLGGWALESQGFPMAEFAWIELSGAPEERELFLREACDDCYNHLFTERPPIGPIAVEEQSWGGLKVLYR